MNHQRSIHDDDLQYTFRRHPHDENDELAGDWVWDIAVDVMGEHAEGVDRLTVSCTNAGKWTVVAHVSFEVGDETEFECITATGGTLAFCFACIADEIEELTEACEPMDIGVSRYE